MIGDAARHAVPDGVNSNVGHYHGRIFSAPGDELHASEKVIGTSIDKYIKHATHSSCGLSDVSPSAGSISGLPAPPTACTS